MDSIHIDPCMSFPYQNIFCILRNGHDGPHYYRSHDDHEFDDCISSANALVRRGDTVYQKFTCHACGNRLTMDVPDKFWTQGTCDQCGEVTDIQLSGCNYLVVMRLHGDPQAAS